MNKGEAFSALKNKIDHWLSLDRANTLTYLAKSTGVPYSTIKRIYKGDSAPTSESLIPILAEICVHSETIDYLREFVPSSGKLVEILSLVQEKNQNIADRKSDDSDILPYVRDDVALVVLELADMHRGTSRQEVEKLFGTSGRIAIEELLGSELIAEDGKGRLRFKTDHKVTMNQKIGLNMVRAFAGAFLITKRANNSISSEAVTPEAVSRLKDIINKAENEIREVILDPKSRGEIPLTVILSIGMLNTPENALTDVKSREQRAESREQRAKSKD